MNQLGLKCGLLGGGQLARMLAQSAFQLGCEVHALSENPSDPVAQVTGFWKQGSARQAHDLEFFAADLDLLTFESEFYDAEQMQQSLLNSKAYLFPSTTCMAMIQNRASQKALFIEYKIPTAAYMEIKSTDDLTQAWSLLGPHVLKTKTGGYDGYGTFVIKKQNQHQTVDANLIDSPGLIAEKWIAFKRECAVILVRSRSGEKLALPLVQSQQKDSKCDWVSGPISHKQWPSMQKKIFRMLDAIDYVGVIGIEFFDTGSELLVNELAPRVHNSGHYSMNALNFSQFDLHWLAGMGRKLPKIILSGKHFLMTNLIGKKISSEMVLTHPLSGCLHWYGKNLSKPGRKMGHINYIGAQPPQLLKTALKERSLFKI